VKPRRLALAVGCALAAPAFAQVTPATLPPTVVDQPFALQFGSGGRPPLAFFVTGGRLPSGLEMGADGVLAGTPVTAGAWSFNLAAIDADGRSALRTYDGEVESDVPVADAQTLTVVEDGTLPITLTATDYGNTSFTFDITEAPQHGALTDSDAQRQYQPAPDYFGADAMQFTASDGSHTSTPALIGITVLPVNDAPGFVGGPDQVVLRNGGAVARPGWAGAISAGPANEAGQQLQFAVTVNTRPSLFAVAPQIAADGTLSFTPSGEAGSAVIGVELRDDGGTANGGVDRSVPQFFSIAAQSPGTDLSIHIDAAAAFVDGAPVQFTVRVENAGPSAATDATVDVTLPPQLVAATWSCTPAGAAGCTANGTGDIADSVDLPVNGAVVYTLQATVAADGVGVFAVDAAVAAGAGQTDPDPSDDQDQHVFQADAIFEDGFEE